MIQIVVASAESVSGEPTEDTQIVIKSDKLTPSRMAYDAAEIVTVLYETLPQGTWKRLVAAIALRWATSTNEQGHISANEWYG